MPAATEGGRRSGLGASRESSSPPGEGALGGAEIRHLAALVAVAREGSFRAAARRLGYAQSALSQQVSELERAAGVRLVSRASGPGATRLTEAGMVLLPRAEEVLARVEAARADLAAAGGGGELRIGAGEGASATLLPMILRELEEVPVEVREGCDDGELLVAVERGSLDLTFADLPLPTGPFGSVELMREPYVLLAPERLAARLDPPTGDRLAAVPLIARAGSPAREALEARLGERALRVVHRPRSEVVARALVAAGLGAAILPRGSARGAAATTRTIDLEGLVEPRRLVLAWHRHRRLSARARQFRDVAIDVGRRLGRAEMDQRP